MVICLGDMKLPADAGHWEKPPRRPRNIAESQFYDLAESKGLCATKRGFPDFACFLPDGSFILVEVKQSRSDGLKYWQEKVMRELVKFGVPCYKWSPDKGFIRIKLPTKSDIK